MSQPLAPTPAPAVLDVLRAPFGALAGVRAEHGWARPWLIVAVAGVLYGVLYLARFDLAAIQAAQSARGLDRLPAAQRKELERPEVKEIMEKAARATALGTKAWLVLGPPVAGLARIGFTAAFVLAICALLRGRGAIVEPRLAAAVAAHAGLVDLVGLAARAVAAAAGQYAPLTSLGNLADPADQPVAFAALACVDPVALCGWLAVAGGLAGACRVPRRMALALAACGWAAVSALAVAMGAFAQLAQGLSKGGA